MQSGYDEVVLEYVDTNAMIDKLIRGTQTQARKTYGRSHLMTKLILE